MPAYHRLCGGAVIALLIVETASARDRVTCSDTAGEITISYQLDRTARPPILSIDMKLTGDFGLSTDPQSPDHNGEYLANGFAGKDIEGADVMWRDEKGRESTALSFRIGRVYGPRDARIGGVVSVSGGGLWTVTCRSSALEQ